MALTTMQPGLAMDGSHGVTVRVSRFDVAMLTAMRDVLAQRTESQESEDKLYLDTLIREAQE